MIQSEIFHYIHHIGYAFNLHSISSTMDLYLKIRIQARDRQYSFCPSILETKSIRILKRLKVPRRAQYLHNTWKKHQDAVHWVDINLEIRKGLTFYQTRSNAIILQGTLPAHCIPKIVRLKTGEVFFFSATEMKNIKIDTSQPTVRALWVTHPTSRPACLKSRSTSCGKGHVPSDPLEPGRSSKDMATARAAAQDRREPQRRRHA